MLTLARGTVGFFFSPEKRKVDSSILSLTTHSHQRICWLTCGNPLAGGWLRMPRDDRSGPSLPLLSRSLRHVGRTPRRRAPSP